VAPSWNWPEQWYQTNIVSKVKIHNALKDSPFLKRYIRISTPEVYGSSMGLLTEDTSYNPSTPYAVSHAAIDMSLKAYHQHYNFPVIFTRFANFYGAGQQLYRITPRAIYCAITGETLPLHGGGTSVRAFIHADDVAKGIWAALEKGKTGETYHFSTDEHVTIKTLVERIAAKVGVAFSSFVEVTEDRPAKDPAYIMASEKAKKELGWSPKYDLDRGLQNAYEWVHGNLDEIKKLPKDYTHKK
jgi:dTDP-glucose 4,6-dehydratase